MTVAEHQTAPTTTPARPTIPILIAGVEYLALCPKMAVWIAAIDGVNRVKETLENLTEGGGSSGGLNIMRQLYGSLVTGQPHVAEKDDAGILWQALEPEAFTLVSNRLSDRRDEIDVDDLIMGGLAVLTAPECREWIAERAKALGIKLPALALTPADLQPAAAVQEPPASVATRQRRVAK